MNGFSPLPLPRRLALAVASTVIVVISICSDTVRAAEGSPEIAPHFQPPQKYAGDFGPYRSPLLFDDGTLVASPADWPRRRDEIAAKWRKIIGPLPSALRNRRSSDSNAASATASSNNMCASKSAPTVAWSTAFS
ncbi:MAG: hypothetical protein QM775_34260 [Pirellulales bacterium]